MISLQHLTFAYGTRTILDGIDVTFASSRLTAIMGANGCGKTTLLRLIGGLLTPTSGQITIGGTPITSYSARTLAQQVAFVRQQQPTDLDFSAFEIVLMGRNPYQHRLQNESQHDWDIVESCMRQTSTWHLRFARPSQMSGGELQRVMIARALAQQTPILLMDEPVSNLDIAHQIDIMRLLRTLKAERTILIAIHDLNLALHTCDDLLLLHGGRALYHGEIRCGLTPDRIRIAYGIETTANDGHIAFAY
ncbi:MAG: ABC transporter ATP-binding protein [Bacteroidales bacterium]|nr:ABC transporter ATP-binding protein [Bacteroidales bacterium]